MIVLDAYALVALIGNEKSAGVVERILKSDGDCAISSINLAEVVDKFLRRKKMTFEQFESVLGPLLTDSLKVLAPGEAVALLAAQLRAKYYHRSRCSLSIADCFLLATAKGADVLITGDSAVIETAKKEKIKIRALEA